MYMHWVFNNLVQVFNYYDSIVLSPNAVLLKIITISIVTKKPYLHYMCSQQKVKARRE